MRNPNNEDEDDFENQDKKEDPDEKFPQLVHKVN